MLIKRMKDLTQLLQQEGNKVEFDDFCAAVRKGMDNSNVYLINRRGKLLGYALEEGYENTPFDQEWLATGEVDEELHSTLLKIGASSIIQGDNGEAILCAPVVGASRRVASLIFVRQDGTFSDDDFVIAEIAATAIGMAISYVISEEEEDEMQETRIARSAIKSLSYSEVLAMQHILDELDGDEGLLVASRIADEAGITRSVIVNALRKLASANVVESRSLGMKGTYLRILNKELRAEFEKQRYPYPKDRKALN
ncbi:MAG: GTP-sensing pleiotropic transcriptional regulator CodY [Firmicutes bacterium]|jgi:transcriptional pleiotropic repressor|nr:GTP-sensing pleiotropic transcriptional regulator CodY [Bacillota bacterium]